MSSPRSHHCNRRAATSNLYVLSVVTLRFCVLLASLERLLGEIDQERLTSGKEVFQANGDNSGEESNDRKYVRRDTSPSSGDTQPLSGDAQSLSRTRSSRDRSLLIYNELRAWICMVRLVILWAVVMSWIVTRPKGMVPNTPENLCRMIVPWTGRKKKPPFAVEELIMMAVLLQGPSTCEDIVVWILRVFYFYFIFGMFTASTVDLLPGGFARSIMYGERAAKEGAKLKTKVYRGLDQCELGLSRLRITKGPHIGRKRYSSSDFDTADFLQDRLRRQALEKRGIWVRRPFPFMRLPTEIRNKVYALVLGFPPSGIVPYWEGHGIARSGPAELRIVHSGYDPFTVLEPDKYDPRGYARSRRIATSLALLQTNKQVFREAMPVFYSLNHFALGRLPAALEILERTSLRRRIHIGHVSLIYSRNHRGVAPRVFGLLNTIIHLERLDIWLDEPSWKRLIKMDGTPQYPDILRIPGMMTLRGMRLRILKFHGNCATFDKLIPEITAAWVKSKRKNAEFEQEVHGLAEKMRRLSTVEPHGRVSNEDEKGQKEVSAHAALAYRPKDDGLETIDEETTPED